MSDLFSAIGFVDDFNVNIATWDTSSVQTMARMFRSAKSFNRPIGKRDTSNVQEMFLGAESFNQRIGGWDTSNVLEMFEMFSGATSFNRDLSTWCVGKVSRFDDFALDSPLRQSFLPPFGTKDNCN